MNLCLKVGDYGDNVSCRGVTKFSHQSPTQIKSILVDIGEKVLVNITIQKLLKQSKSSYFVFDVWKWVRSFLFSIFQDVYQHFKSFLNHKNNLKMVLLFCAQYLHLQMVGVTVASSLLYADIFLHLVSLVAKCVILNLKSINEKYN